MLKTRGQGRNKKERKWRVIENIDEEDPIEYESVGIRGFDFSATGRKRISFLKLLIHMWPGNWKDHLSKINKAIVKENLEQVIYTKFVIILFSNFIVTN